MGKKVTAKGLHEMRNLFDIASKQFSGLHATANPTKEAFKITQELATNNPLGFAALSKNATTLGISKPPAILTQTKQDLEFVRMKYPERAQYASVDKVKSNVDAMVMTDVLEEVIFLTLDTTGPCSINDIIRLTFSFEVDVDIVIITVRAMQNAGILVSSSTFSKTKSETFTIKKGITMAALKLKNMTPTKIKSMEHAHIFDPAGAIVFEEGMDRAIWKFMQDRKAYALDTIGAALVEFGFKSVDIRDRVIYLCRSKKWLERMGTTGSNITYVLKKHVKMPGLPKYALEEAEKAEVKGVAAVFDNVVQHIVPVVEEIKPEVPVEEEVAMEAPVHAPLSKNDGVNTSIWKFMSDYKPYTTTEVEFILHSELGIKKSTVKSRLSYLYLNLGWFDRSEPSTSTTPAVYTLRRNIPMPVGESPYLPRDRVKVTPTPPEQKAEPVVAKEPAPVVSHTSDDLFDRDNTPQKHEGVLTALTTSTKVPEGAVSAESKPVRHMAIKEFGESEVTIKPVLPEEFSVVTRVVAIRIRGNEFTMEEAETMAADLIGAGFGIVDEQEEQTNALVKFEINVTIAHMSFTRAEAEALSRNLQKHGFGKTAVE